MKASGGLALVLAITFFTLAPCLKHDFVNWDDEAYITMNQAVQKDLFSNAKEIFTTPVNGFYVPLTLLSFQVEHHFFGLSPKAYHVNNLLLHLANVCLLFVFLRRLTGQQLAALLAALLFGVHTLNVESVAWASERKDLLYTFFGLLALLAYLRYLQGRAALWLAASVGCFVLSLAAKPQWLMLPVVLLLVDYWRGRFEPWPLRFAEPPWKIALEKLPFFALSAATGWLLLAEFAQGVDAPLAAYSFTDRLLFSGYQLFTYAHRLVLPLELSATYPFPVRSAAGWYPPVYYLALPLVAAALLWLLWKYGRQRLAMFGLLFYLVNIFPMLQVVSLNTSLVYDRFNYVPFWGPFLLLGMWAEALWQSKAGTPLLRWRPVVLAAAALWAGLLCVWSYQRSLVWRNTETLFTDIVEKDFKNHHIFKARGDYYLRRGQIAQATNDYNIALRIAPTNTEALSARAFVMENTGQVAQAIADYSALLQLLPPSEQLLAKRGQLLAQAGQVQAALADLRQALQLNPQNAQVRQWISQLEGR